MKSIAFIALAAGGIAGAQVSSAPSNSGIDRYLGHWQGALAAGGMRLRMALTLTRDSSNRITAVMTSVDQGGAKIPGTASFEGDTLVMKMPLALASYRAVLNARGDTIAGTFTQGGNSLPLALGRSSAITVARRPQEPKPPFPYRTEDLSVQSTGGVKLGCTLDLPEGSGPFPAAVFATGSGPQDRNEMLLGHKPFLLIADYLARHGIASLRCDDRGVGLSTGRYAAASVADFARDAQAGVEYLRTRSEIAKNKIGIIGHSEGGMIGPMVAAQSRDVAFVVMLAGPGIRGDSLLVLQGRLIGEANHATDTQLAQQSAVQHALFAAILGAKDSADAYARVVAAEQQLVSTLPDTAQPQARRALEQQRAQILSPELREIIAYDPRPILLKLTVPVLALNGTRDLQVPYKEDLAGIEAALKAAGNRDYTLVPMTGLNHLFQPATTGSPAEYAEIEETMSPVVLETIANWINQRFGKH